MTKLNITPIKAMISARLVTELDEKYDFHIPFRIFIWPASQLCAMCYTDGRRNYVGAYYGKYMNICSCLACHPKLDMQLDIYRIRQLKKYVLCWMIMNKIIIKDISMIIIGNYYHSQGILREDSIFEYSRKFSLS